MPTNITGALISASRVILQSPFKVKGNQEFVITSNFLTWGESCSSISDIAATFGQPVPGDSAASLRLRCGNSEITTFDFGLLYSVFCAMGQAHLELGDSFSGEYTETSEPDISATWVGNELIIHSLQGNLILPANNAEVENICGKRKIEVQNFVDNRRFFISREGMKLLVSTEKDEFLCRVVIPETVKRSYYRCFNDDLVVRDDVTTPWDESSPLGSLISESVSSFSLDKLHERYLQKVPIDSIALRNDLIFTPNKRYESASAFPGTICYTDKSKIVLSVNIRGDMFVYRDWFQGSSTARLSIYTNPDYSKFFDVTAECRRIMEFSQTVVTKPISAAEFDLSVFSRIKEKYLSMQLKRLPIAAAFGKAVIPERVLLKEIHGQIGETIYFAVPVGIIGDSIICKNSDGLLDDYGLEDWNGYCYEE